MRFKPVLRFFARCVMYDAQPPSRSASAVAKTAVQLGIQDWEPQLVQRLEANLQSNAEQDFALSSPNREYLLILGRRGVDLLYTQQSDTGDWAECQVSFDAFLRTAARLLPGAVDLSHSQAHRLAALQEGVLPMGQEARSDVRRRLITLPASCGEQEPFEWDWRYAQKVPRRFGAIKSDEMTNTIAWAKYMPVSIPAGAPQARCLVASTDINTQPESKDARFGSVEVEGFFTDCMGWHRELERSTLEHLGVEQ